MGNGAPFLELPADVFDPDGSTSRDLQATQVGKHHVSVVHGVAGKEHILRVEVVVDRQGQVQDVPGQEVLAVVPAVVFLVLAHVPKQDKARRQETVQRVTDGLGPARVLVRFRSVLFRENSTGRLPLLNRW